MSHYQMYIVLPQMLKWNEHQTAIFRRFAGWRWRVSERALQERRGLLLRYGFYDALKGAPTATRARAEAVARLPPVKPHGSMPPSRARSRGVAFHKLL